MTTNSIAQPLIVGSFEEAEVFRLRAGLAWTPAQRLLDLEEMLEFNKEADARNPGPPWAAERLRR